uniref:Uncharacterized protein n=1 Tax=Corethron hystrix TaxID=216773 RepID=A0A7S1FJZ0_9STRA|mmetsp:Transcript_10134/g.22510  ORF Transcript_10134/g.22510 Transcript_10134/m.22510 type:complete len:234 (+) Transcript_10134:213-914(+)
MINEILPIDVLKKVLGKIPVSYRFLCSVNRDFRDAYLDLFKGNFSTCKYKLSSMPALQLYLNERTDRRLSDEEEASYIGARSGQIDMIKWSGRLDEWTCVHAARGGHEHVLTWLQEQGCETFTRSTTCSGAAKGGNLDTLKWLRKQGCDWDEKTCASAASGGHLELLIWARQEGCKWDWRTCASAAEGGHVEVLKWARKKWCRWNNACTIAAKKGGHLEILEWLKSVDGKRKK